MKRFFYIYALIMVSFVFIQCRTNNMVETYQKKKNLKYQNRFSQTQKELI